MLNTSLHCSNLYKNIESFVSSELNLTLDVYSSNLQYSGVKKMVLKSTVIAIHRTETLFIRDKIN